MNIFTFATITNLVLVGLTGFVYYISRDPLSFVILCFLKGISNKKESDNEDEDDEEDIDYDQEELKEEIIELKREINELNNQLRNAEEQLTTLEMQSRDTQQKIFLDKK